MLQNRKTVLQTAILVSGLSILSKLLGFVREQVIAWRFGASAAVDSYVAALLVPQAVPGLIDGAIGIAFLPIYSSLKGREEGKRLAGTLLASIAFPAVIIAVAAIIFAPLIVQVVVGNFSPEQQALTVTMVRTLSLGMLFLSMNHSFVKEGWGKHFKEQQTPLRLPMAHYVSCPRFRNLGKGNGQDLLENLLASAGVTPWFLFLE